MRRKMRTRDKQYYLWRALHDIVEQLGRQGIPIHSKSLITLDLDIPRDDLHEFELYLTRKTRDGEVPTIEEFRQKFGETTGCYCSESVIKEIILAYQQEPELFGCVKEMKL